MRLVFRYVLFVMAIETEAVRFGLEEESVPGAVWIVTGQAASGDKGAVNECLVGRKLMADGAKLLLGRHQVVELITIVTCVALLCRIGSVFRVSRPPCGCSQFRSRW